MPVADPVAGAAAEQRGVPVIAVRGGHFGYRGQVAVSADLEIHPGEVVALLGPNGSGKTTLMKGMLGLVERMGGTVELFGQPLREFRDRSLIGYVPQRQTAAGPIPVTVRELVRSGRLARKGLLRRRNRADDAAVAAAIDAVGLADRAGEPVSTLSGGQQRRALVARALAGGATVLLLDEPLAGVDQANQGALADTLAALVAARPPTAAPGTVTGVATSAASGVATGVAAGVTIIVVLHELGPLEPLVTRAICLDTGAVRFDGPLATAPPALLHLGHDHDPHGGDPDAGRSDRPRLGLLP